MALYPNSTSKTTTTSVSATTKTTQQASSAAASSAAAAAALGVQEFIKTTTSIQTATTANISIGGMSVEKDSEAFTIAVMADPMQEAGLLSGCPLQSNSRTEMTSEEQLVEVSFAFLAALGVTISGELKDYSLIPTQTDVTVLKNPNIVTSTFKASENVDLSDKFSNVDDPIFALDDEASVHVGNQVAPNILPNLTGIAASMASSFGDPTKSSSSKFDGLKG